jgi:hypothetical protein
MVDLWIVGAKRPLSLWREDSSAFWRDGLRSVLFLYEKVDYILTVGFFFPPYSSPFALHSSPSMLRNSAFSFLIVFLFLTLWSCNQPFDPRAPYRDRLIVYSVLSNDRQQQFVRLFTTYDSDDFNPSSVTAENPVIGAMVVISPAGFGSIQGTDTVLSRPDTSRYRSPLNAYVFPLQIQYGTVYTLAATTPLGAVGSVVRMPGQGFLAYTGVSVLRQPINSAGTAEIVITGALGQFASAFVVRMTLEYDVTDSTGTVSKSTEVPASFPTIQTEEAVPLFDYSRPSYPVLQRIGGNTFRAGFRNYAYIFALESIKNREAGKSITYRKAMFTLVQAEENLFKYFSVTNSFQDSLSIRLDQPQFTNINGGLGVFGAYAVDTVSFSYQSTFIYNQ